MSATATDTEWVLDQEPVTIQEWIDVMGETALPEQLKLQDRCLPVAGVTALEADEFARRVGGRLPTDEELAEAFRTGTVRRKRLATWEWTSTADGSARVYRGGCWFYDLADNLSASYRDSVTPEYRYVNLGLRCARPLIEPEPHVIPNEEPHWPAKDVDPSVRHPIDPYVSHRADLRKPRPGIRTRLQRIASGLHAATCVTAEVRCKEAYAALGEILDALDEPPFDDAPGVEATQEDILAELTARLERDGASPTGCGARPDEDIEKLAREEGQP